MIERQGSYFRIPDAAIKESLRRLQEHIEYQCELGFGRNDTLSEDPNRVEELQSIVQQFANFRTSTEHDPTGSRYQLCPRLHGPQEELVDVANAVLTAATAAHSRASDAISLANPMGPYQQKVETLIQMLIREVSLYARLSEIHEDCPVYNMGLSVLTNDDLDEMELGIVGPFLVGESEQKLIEWWQNVDTATRGDGVVLRGRKIALGDPIFAVSYKHNGPGGLSKRMDISDWLEIHKIASKRAMDDYFCEYFLWIDIEYSRNRTKSQSWSRGGILAYMSCEVVTTNSDIQDSYWCRLERFVAGVSFGLTQRLESQSTADQSDSELGLFEPVQSGDHRRISPAFDIHTVVKNAAQLILMTDMIRQNRLWEEDAKGLIKWAMFATYKAPRVTVGMESSKFVYGEPFLYSLMEMISWWSPSNCLRSMLAMYRSSKRHGDERKPKSSSWNVLKEWIPHNLLDVPDSFWDSDVFAPVYQRIQARRTPVEPDMHLITICYTHFDGTQSNMMVILRGPNVYDATVLRKELCVKAMRVGITPTAVDLRRVTWRLEEGKGGDPSNIETMEVSKEGQEIDEDKPGGNDSTPMISTLQEDDEECQNDGPLRRGPLWVIGTAAIILGLATLCRILVQEKRKTRRKH